MPMELQVIRAQEFIRLGAKGHFDMKASKMALAQLAAACCKRGINQALLDLRSLHPRPKPIFSPNDLVKLVNTFHEVGFTDRHRLAVLYGSDPHHRARLFAFIAKMRHWKVQAFDNFEEAIIWLSATDETLAPQEFTPTAKAVPVRRQEEVQAARTPPQPRITVKNTGSRRRQVGVSKSGKARTPAAQAVVVQNKISAFSGGHAKSPRASR